VAGPREPDVVFIVRASSIDGGNPGVATKTRRVLHFFLTIWNIQSQFTPSSSKTILHEYDENFYRFLASFAVRSVEQIIPLLSALLPINSVVDFGCGQGDWAPIRAVGGQEFPRESAGSDAPGPVDAIYEKC
jgi:hypothetical protein